jgi:hypothetical protein
VGSYKKLEKEVVVLIEFAALYDSIFNFIKNYYNV